jgi:phosphatidylserine decarboxylase
VAQEGLPFLLILLVLIAIILRYGSPLWAIPPALLFALLMLVFRDPPRPVPSSPLGVVSPIDGKVISVERVSTDVLHGEAWRIVLAIDSWGTYTARCPVEGKIMNIRAEAKDRDFNYRTNALWVQTDEGVDVVLQFHGYRFGLAPRSFMRYGERLGQGQRCAYLRLTRFAEVHLPADSKILVEAGDVVIGGSDLLAKVTH